MWFTGFQFENQKILTWRAVRSEFLALVSGPGTLHQRISGFEPFPNRIRTSLAGGWGSGGGDRGQRHKMKVVRWNILYII